jgi:hypothetical protein
MRQNQQTVNSAKSEDKKSGQMLSFPGNNMRTSPIRSRLAP